MPAGSGIGRDPRPRRPVRGGAPLLAADLSRVPGQHRAGWLGWLLHGRLAVVVFITLSGFSLAIAPARDGWRLRGTLRFARRRAWRILPTYWAALVFSLVIAAAVTPLPLSAPPTVRSVVVYGLLMQDIVVAPVPNGAFWSIAVEAGLYLAFPLLLLIRRRAGAVAMLAAVTVPVVAIGLLHPDVSDGGEGDGVHPGTRPAVHPRPGRRRNRHRAGPDPPPAVALAGRARRRPGGPADRPQRLRLDGEPLLLDRPRDRPGDRHVPGRRGHPATGRVGVAAGHPAGARASAGSPTAST